MKHPLRRSNFIFADPHPVWRLLLAMKAVTVVAELAQSNDEEAHS